MEIREFRGYRNGELMYTFPLHWVDSIDITEDGMEVNYFDESNCDKLTSIVVDFINVK